MRHQIYVILLFLAGCNTSTSGTAVAFLWNEEPTAESSKIMVLSELSEPELRDEVISNVEAMGFVIDEVGEELLITEPKDLDQHAMVMVVEFNNNSILISAREGAGEDPDDWPPVVRGKGEITHAWQLMEVLANATAHTSVKYN